MKLKVLVLGIVFGCGYGLCLVFSDATHQSVNMNFPGGYKFEIDATRPEIDHKVILEGIYKNEFLREGLLGWLATHDIFKITNDDLAVALNKNLCEPIPQQPLSARLKSGQACAELEVAKGLRNLSAQKHVPFHYVGISVQVGIPSSSNQPLVGQANVCNQSELLGKLVELMNPQINSRIEVQATQRYPCTLKPYPDIQLNATDASQLFTGAFGEYQEAIAVVLN